MSVEEPAANTAPVLAAIPAQTIDENAPLTFTASATDDNLPANTLTYSLSGAPSGALIDANTGVFTWTPSEVQGPGVFNFNAIVSDGDLTDSKPVSVTVNEVNIAPVAIGQNDGTAEDTALSITLSGTDADNNPLTYSIATTPTNGTLSGTAPNLTYTPAPDFSGTDAFTFIANDGTVGSAPATVSITVTPVNDAPVAIAQSTSVAEDGSVPITLTGSDAENSALVFTSSRRLPTEHSAASRRMSPSHPPPTTTDPPVSPSRSTTAPPIRQTPRSRSTSLRSMTRPPSPPARSSLRTHLKTPPTPVRRLPVLPPTPTRATPSPTRRSAAPRG